MESYYKAKHTYAPENTDELSFKKGLKIGQKRVINYNRRRPQTDQKGRWGLVGG